MIPELTPLPDDLRAWVEDGTPVVYANLGTLALASREQLVRMLGAFRSDAFRVLWVLKDELQALLPEARPANVRIESWIPSPFSLLFNENVRVFVSHCGILSVHESLDAGTPIVGIPMLGGQRDMAMRVVGTLPTSRHAAKALNTVAASAQKMAIVQCFTDMAGIERLAAALFMEQAHRAVSLRSSPALERSPVNDRRVLSRSTTLRNVLSGGPSRRWPEPDAPCPFRLSSEGDSMINPALILHLQTVHGARIPYRHLPRLRDGRLLLVGDAAGLNTPIVFAGIPIALQSGRLAGRLCAAALRLGSDLPLAGYTVEAMQWMSPAFTAGHAYYEHLVAERRPPSFPWLARRFALRPHRLPQVHVIWNALNRLVDGLDLERMAPRAAPPARVPAA